MAGSESLVSPAARPLVSTPQPEICRFLPDPEKTGVLGGGVAGGFGGRQPTSIAPPADAAKCRGRVPVPEV